ncbi:MAG: dicarboxylate/amino acid:cation symporter [Oligoflexia bacterium]|nr:dicarboxylate/amino acid:cation symporter [Oligoflexia bacterium]
MGSRISPEPAVPLVPPSAPRQRLALHWQILIGMAAGLVVGLLVNAFQGPLADLAASSALAASVMDFLAKANQFVGDLFLRGLRFIAVPIVLFSLVVGSSSLNDLKKLSRIGGRTIIIYLLTTSLAITVGLVLANITRPGTWLSPELRDHLATAAADTVSDKLQAAAAPDVWATLLNMVPQNPFAALAQGNMLQVVFLALAIGAALTLVPKEKAEFVIKVADGLTDAIIKLVGAIMLTAPVAVFCLIAGVMATMGIQVLSALLVYSLTVIGGLLIMTLGVYPLLLKVFSGVGPRRFFEAILPAQLLAFSSSSSSATLPVTMECVEGRMGVGEDVTSFVIPLGATINMDGTALYQGVAALFIAQLYGIPLDLGAQLTIVLTATLASVGTAGVPGVGLIMLVIVLQAVGIGDEAMKGGIAIIFGVDRLLDMCRTTTNVTGDAMVATVIAAREGDLLTAQAVADRRAERQAVGMDENP